MRFLDNLPIGRKVLLALSVMGATGLGTGYHAVSMLAETDNLYHDLVTREAQSAIYLSRANTAFVDAARLVARTAEADSTTEARTAWQQVLDARQRTDEHLAAAERAKPDLSARLAEFRNGMIRARETAEEVRRLALAGSGEAAREAVNQRYNPAQEQARINLRAIVERSQRQMSEASDAATAQTDRTYWVVLGAGMLGVLLSLGLALWMMVGGVSRPIGRIEARMKALAAGEKDSPVPGAGRRDEVGRMADAVEVFRRAAIEQDRLAEAVAADGAAKAARAERIDALVRGFEAQAAEALRTVASAATELDATAGEMQATAQGGRERAVMLAAASEEASANVQTVAASAEEMTASIAEVARQVGESARVVRQAAGTARATDAAVAELSESAQRIGEVVRLISGIASQTNLLALNATIEAARAGEAGKGFAVVASEVKALASQTTKATEEIGARIAGMQTETGRAVEAIRSIAATIEGVDGLTTQVAAAAEQQAAAVQEIGRAVAEAASGTREVSRHAGGVTGGAEQTGAAATQVRAASGELAQRAEGLRAEVDRFLTGIRAA
ncbi:methyl-accepting chemotaxis protein [Falsiroseomonas sp. CW058]|uniref:methyl-accepting chemotaxis protein n=1 Tax=Falsiroseomonas sp. CW058 TaxID=3388664 RepID=UPI003D31FBBE